jgi:hypothetical protein
MIKLNLVGWEESFARMFGDIHNVLLGKFEGRRPV